ncbi:hyoscyamine 6-dioxygenase-like [Impatiens glandulifera]|uniref:hyoscyamine 6-dioxygenase-like n=1 Tax=Impatiens glandulifera TaxID=253017 RepID=UPI001FB07B62|nr:hyoscyamine 6-dioxygenase-like [Impatiens glandulifera]
MTGLVSSWSKDVQSLPESYILPQDQRPSELVSEYINILVDLNNCDQFETIHEILEAGKDLGFFQVINHGISENIVDETREVVKEFFVMPSEVQKRSFKVDVTKRCRLYTSTFNYDKEEVHLWRDNLTHPCHPFHDSLHLFPQHPTRYREVVGKYCGQVKELSTRILELIGLGLDLEEGYFEKENRSDVHLFSVNHYPRCPQPSLTLGMNKHCDPNLITILNQGEVAGLQIYKNGKWISIQTIPNAFVVILGYQMRIISNDRLTSAEHRVVTCSEADRTTLGYFVVPSDECLIEPAKEIVNHQPIYKTGQYKDFLNVYGQTKGSHLLERELCRVEEESHAHLSAIDDDMWLVITEGPIKIEKDRFEWTSKDSRKNNLDNLTMNIMYKTMDDNMFNHIISCNSAKEIWERLTQPYKGNEQTKENKLMVATQ